MDHIVIQGDEVEAAVSQKFTSSFRLRTGKPI